MLLFGIAFVFLQENKGCAKNKLISLFKNAWTSLFLFYISWVMMGAVFGRQQIYPYEKVFEGFWFVSNNKLNRDAIKNVLVFIPVTFLNLNAFPTSKPFKRALKVSVLLTCIIEGSQLLFWLGNFQISDIIHNILGGVIGYLVWRAYTKLRIKLYR